MIIAVDFDGTLAQYDRWRGAGSVGAPIGGAIEFLRWLDNMGHEPWIYSARASEPAGRLAIEEWVVKYGVDDIVKGITHEKLYRFSLFIDDRAIPFAGNWSDVTKAITKVMTARNARA